MPLIYRSLGPSLINILPFWSYSCPFSIPPTPPTYPPTGLTRAHAHTELWGIVRYFCKYPSLSEPWGLVPLSVAEVLPSLLTFGSRGSTETSAGVHVYKSMWSNLWWSGWTTSAASLCVSAWKRSCSELLLSVSPSPSLQRLHGEPLHEHLLTSRDFFLKILTSVLNRFHSLPLRRVNCQLLLPWKKGEGNLTET